MTFGSSALVDAPWLGAHLDEVTVVDVRWYLDGRSGRDAYARGHIPGAVFLDVDADLAGPPSRVGGRHPLPDPERFATALGRVGITADAPVVAYDDAGGSIAARLWWMLRAIEQPVAVLDGGIDAWPGPLSTDTPHCASVVRPGRPWPAERFVDSDDVARLDVDSGGLLLDARTTERFDHGDPVIDPRPGHIPGAKSAPWMANLDPTSGRLLDPEALRDRYRALGAVDSERVVVYCGSGVTACHDLLALEVAGITSGALFTGSWSAWGADPRRPAETGPTPS